MPKATRNSTRDAERRSRKEFQGQYLGALDVYSNAIQRTRGLLHQAPGATGEQAATALLQALLGRLSCRFEALDALLERKRDGAWELAVIESLSLGLEELLPLLPASPVPADATPASPGDQFPIAADGLIYNRAPIAYSSAAGAAKVPTAEVLVLLRALLAMFEAILAEEAALLTAEELAILRTIIAQLKSAILQVSAHGKRVPLAQVERIIDRVFAIAWQFGERVHAVLPRVLARIRHLVTALRPGTLWLRHILRIIARYMPHLAALLIGMIIGHALRQMQVQGVTLGEALDDLVYQWVFADATGCEGRFRLFTQARRQKLEARAAGQERLERAFARQEIRFVALYLASDCPDVSLKKSMRRLFKQLQASYRRTYGKR